MSDKYVVWRTRAEEAETENGELRRREARVRQWFYREQERNAHLRLVAAEARRIAWGGDHYELQNALVRAGFAPPQEEADSE